MECYIPVFFSCVCVSFGVSSAEICCCFVVDTFTVFHVCCLRFWCCARSLLLTWSDYSTSTHALTHGPGRLVGLLYLISLSFLLDSWFFPSTFPSLPCSQAYVPLYLMYSLSETVLLPGWPFSYLGFDPVTLTCFQCIGIPVYLSGHGFAHFV